MLGDELHNGAAHDDTVGQPCHVPGLLRGGDAKADGAGRLRLLPGQPDDLSNIAADLTSHARNAQGGHAVEELSLIHI